MLDYGSRINRVLYESNPTESKHYLYGGDLCLAEFVTDEVEEETAWRYYLYDGNGYVRQTVNEHAAPTYAWTFSAEGAVLLGEEGPVTHLSCNGDAVYEWSVYYRTAVSTPPPSAVPFSHTISPFVLFSVILHPFLLLPNHYARIQRPHPKRY